MNEPPLISVIIPVYNVEQYIERCIRSVIVQTYKNLEIIVVDDGSTDNSGRICDKLAQEDNRIKVFHQSNGGVSAARNIGLREAHGEFIGFVDGDDFIDSDMYDYLYSLIKDNKADISFCRFRHFGYPDVFSDDDEEKGKFDVIYGKEAIYNFVKNKRHFKGYIWGAIYKKDITNFFNETVKIYEDEIFKINCFLNSKFVVLGKEIKYNYCYNNLSLIRSKNYKVYVENTQIEVKYILSILNQLADQKLISLYYRKIFKRFLKLFIVNVKITPPHYSLCRELKSLIIQYANLTYIGRQSWKAQIIALILFSDNFYFYGLIIKFSDKIHDALKLFFS